MMFNYLFVIFAEPKSVLASDKFLNHVARYIGRGWQQLGIHLDLTQHELFVIQANNPYDVQNQIYQMLVKWKEKKGQKATQKALINTMIDSSVDADWCKIYALVGK